MHLEPLVVPDPKPDGPRNPWRTYLACLEATENLGSHTLILQDDAVLCEGFMEAAQQVITAVPEALVAFFVPALTRRNRVRMLGGGLVTWDTQEWVPCVATSWPKEHAAQAATWGRERYGERVKADDAVVGAFCRSRRIPVYATSPSLVEHDESVPSLMTQRVSRNRRALVPLNGQDPCGIQWT